MLSTLLIAMFAATPVVCATPSGSTLHEAFVLPDSAIHTMATHTSRHRGLVSRDTVKHDTTMTPADTNAVWVCPMDPEVRAKEPGRCPKCGMTLVKQAPKKPVKDSTKTPSTPKDSVKLASPALHQHTH